jgi:hypothetical protein
MEFITRNTNTLAPLVYDRMVDRGIQDTSRNGPVLRLPGVTTITLNHPWERVNLCPVRDANPFFHLLEAMAMLVGERGNSVELLSYFASNMRYYADGGDWYNAFYGQRMRHTWGDQLAQVVNELRHKPDTRQAVICLWDPHDLWRVTNDKACNLVLIFQLEQGSGQLDMVTFNRSNDAIWGGINGANMVHLSLIHETVANAISRPMGVWHHTSANLHVYVDNPKWPALRDAPFHQSDYPEVDPEDRCPLVPGGSLEGTTIQLHAFINRVENLLDLQDGRLHLESRTPLTNRFLLHTAWPMVRAFKAHKDKQYSEAQAIMMDVHAADWKQAGIAWLNRRHNKTSPQP